jgi:hypothetical protein
MNRMVLALAFAGLAWACACGAASAQGRMPPEARALRSIMQQEKICQINLSSMERRTVSYKDYARLTPGSFQSFGWLKLLYNSGVRSPINPKSAEALIFMRLGGGGSFSTCNQLDTRIQALRAPVPKGAACTILRRLVTCVRDVETIHRSHVGKRNIYKDLYDSKLDVYDKVLIYKRGR